MKYNFEFRGSVFMKRILVLVSIMIVFVSIFTYLVVVNSNPIKSEYVPEEEIADTDLRNTIITLYFESQEDGEMETEARLVDSKDLLNDPYSYLINLLIEGPKNQGLRKNIPEGTKLNGTYLLGECLTIDLSKEFIKNSKGDSLQKSNIIYALVNTVTELKEVSRVKILIDGEESDGFDDVGISFKEEFIRKENN